MPTSPGPVPRPLTDVLFLTQVIKFAALFSALLHRITEALYCGNFKWLVVDIPLDHVTSYLPDEHQRKEGVDSQISLGNLLEAFRDLYKGKEALWGQVKRKVRV